MLFLFFAALSYLAGSLSSAIIVSKLLHLPDPRLEGSKNPGTTNVLRLGGKKAAIIVLAGDVLKGLLPVLLAKLCGLHDAHLGWIGAAAFLGHLYPLFFKFKGGKGVATAVGVIIALSPTVGLVLIATWVIVAKVSRYSSLAAITATCLAPVYAWFITKGTYMPGIIFMCLILLWRHRENIKRLHEGSENKIQM